MEQLLAAQRRQAGRAWHQQHPGDQTTWRLASCGHHGAGGVGHCAAAQGISAVKEASRNVLESGYYLGIRAARRFAGTTLRSLVTGFGASAASNNCRHPCDNSSTAFPNAPSCPTRTIATDRCRSNDGGRRTFTGSTE